MIHLNLDYKATNLDIFESYYFARKLDQNMQFDLNGWCDVEQAIKKTEWHFENEFDTRDFAAKL